jgi:hypothetical protein
MPQSIIMSPRIPGGDWGTFMPNPTDLLNQDREVASNLKQLALEEPGDDGEFDEATALRCAG